MISVYDIAEEFIQETSCPVFVTGKAGSGKTTMLRQIKEGTYKQAAVVAPTGVAAINAGGVTIHSMFQLPFSPFVPTPEGRRALIAKQQMSEVRRKVLRTLELLIIDEVSMVRADVLDAMDTVLRHYRYRRNEPFGGVQVVYIGDMYQLPPVCVGEEWDLLREYYRSPYFFHSHVVGEQPPVYIELDRIFRQSNVQFINVLNEVRNNSVTGETLMLLERRHRPGYRAAEGDGYITLTTHNAAADAINMEELGKIEEVMFRFAAKIQGEFAERNYPTDVELQLKRGARVMFIANDASQPRRYFNGKIGVVTDITADEIWVTCEGEVDPILVVPEVWENKSYTMNRAENRIDEKLLGTFTQYPLRLAWAITIHKSQGLTFDKVIIDAGAAFASGQVYVALSRCRSLDGIILTSAINPNSLAVDPNIVSYGSRRVSNAELVEQVEVFKRQYSVLLLTKLFSMEELMAQTVEFHQYVTAIIADFNEETGGFIAALLQTVTELYNVALRFLCQLRSFDAKRDAEKVAERVRAAAGYYTVQLSEVITLVEASPAITESKTEAQDYVERLKGIFESAHRLRQVIGAVGEDMSVSNYFAAKQECRVPAFRVKAYAVEREVKLLKTDHPVLYARLAKWRNEYCREKDLPVYVVCTNATIVEMSNRLPVNAGQLLKIKGFGKKKVENYGEECTGIIRKYCEEIGVDVDRQAAMDFPEESVQKEKKETRERRAKEKKPHTTEVTLELLKGGMSIDDIARERGMVPTTIYGHAAQLIRTGLIGVREVADGEVVERVMEVLRETPEMSNTELYERFEGRIPFEVLRMIRAHQLATDEKEIVK